MHFDIWGTGVLDSRILLKLFTLLLFPINLEFANEYKPFNAEENQLIQAKKKTLVTLPPYTQVFENKHGFLSGKVDVKLASTDL